MMKRSKLFLVILTFLLVGCGTVAQQKTQITLTTNDTFKYDPTAITVKVGEPVQLTIKNKGAIEHDFVIDKIKIKDVVQQAVDGMQMDDMPGMDHHDDANHKHYSLHVATPAGGSSVITFTPTQAGTYEFFCTVKGHQEAGMTGTLTVTQ